MTLESQDKARKQLVLRLSSLGDVILATAVLETERLRGGVDWVIAEEFSPILEGHPRIRKLWKFSRRKSGLRGWIALCRNLWAEGYDSVIDLHGSLRTRILKVLFRYWSWKENRTLPVWSACSKERPRLYGYWLLKALWPRHLRPEPVRQRFSKAAGGTGKEVPNLSHLVSEDREPWMDREYICVMPDSLWAGKRWPVTRYLELLKNIRWLPVVLGTRKDDASQELAVVLQQSGREHVSGVGKWELRKTASVLAHSRAYLGSDTGLAHLAEAVGTPAIMVFGPTAPDQGFGPWRKESRALGSDLWCRPCGKDGRNCFRVWDRHACMKRLGTEEVERAVNEVSR